MGKQYIIYNFIDEYLENYSSSGIPLLTPFKKDAIKFNLKIIAEAHLFMLHNLGYTGLQIKEYEAGLYD